MGGHGAEPGKRYLSRDLAEWACALKYEDLSEKAVATADSTSKKTIQQRMDQYSEYFRKQQQLIKKEQEQQGGKEAAQAQLEDPFGALGGAASSP